MEFEILPIEPYVEEKYDVIRVISPEKWLPYRYRKAIMVMQPYDPTEISQNHEKVDYPATLNYTSSYKSSTDLGENFEIPLET